MFWRIDTITDKHQVSVYVHVLSLSAGECDKIIREFESFASLCALDSQFGFRIGFNTHKRRRLPEASLRARAFQTDRF
ncbi:MAG TPA: hypothetical protein VNT76_23525, partial [Candidatus Binatus sp.]|nr:hypothetical protein [Candidatus Binatus sp.]